MSLKSVLLCMGMSLGDIGQHGFAWRNGKCFMYSRYVYFFISLFVVGGWVPVRKYLFINIYIYIFIYLFIDSFI